MRLIAIFVLKIFRCCHTHDAPWLVMRCDCELEVKAINNFIWTTIVQRIMFLFIIFLAIVICPL